MKEVFVGMVVIVGFLSLVVLSGSLTGSVVSPWQKTRLTGEITDRNGVALCDNPRVYGSVASVSIPSHARAGSDIVAGTYVLDVEFHPNDYRVVIGVVEPKTNFYEYCADVYIADLNAKQVELDIACDFDNVNCRYVSDRDRLYPELEYDARFVYSAFRNVPLYERDQPWARFPGVSYPLMMKGGK